MTKAERHIADWTRAASLLAAMLVVAPIASAEERALSERPLLYRRILVPADQPAAWPRECETFLPLAKGDFEDFVSKGVASEPRARLIAAEYRARLEEGQIVVGKGTWDVDVEGEGTALLALGLPSIVIKNLVWEDSAAAVEMGWWQTVNGVGLRVPAAGKLDFDWHSRRGTSAAGELRMPLNLPMATRSRFVIDLPTGKLPTIDGGVTLANEAVDGSPDVRRWTIAIGDAPHTELRIASNSSQDLEHAPIATLRQRLHYRVTRRGLDLNATLNLRWESEAATALHLELPTDLHLVAAEIAGQPLQWHVTSGGDSSASRATIKMPDATTSQTSTITLRAIAPFVAGRTFLLPAPRVVDTFWTSGSIEIAADESVEISRVAAVDCVESTDDDDPKGDRNANSRIFDAYAPTAGVQAAFSPRRSRCQVAMGTSLRIGGAGVVSRMVAQIGAAEGSLYRAYAEVQPGWTIDAVETVPAEALGQWFLDSHDDRGTLELQFNRAVERGAGVTVLVTGRRQESAGGELLAHDALTMIDWRDFEVTRNLLRLEAAEPFELEAIDKLPSIAIDALTSRDRELVGVPGNAPIIDLAQTRQALVLRLAPKRGGYRAEIEHVVEAAPERLVNRYQAVCRPLQSGVGHVLVFFSQPLPAEPRWVETGTGSPVVARRMPADDPRLGGLPTGGELWQLNLRGLYARRVTLRAEIELPWTDRATLPLLSLPEAGEQVGRIAVHAADTPPIVDATGMMPVPLVATPLADAPDSSRSCAAFRYRPLQFYATGEPAQFSIAPAPTPSVEMPLLATNVDVESVVLAERAARHRLRYRLENRGARRIAFKIPAGLWFEGALIDGSPVVNESFGADVELQLPARPLTTLTLTLIDDRPAVGRGVKLPPPVPRPPGLEILHGTWTIWLPEEFVATGADFDRSFDWRRRLFGPLARGRDDGVFNPFSVEGWTSVLPAGVSRAAVAASAGRAAPDTRTTAPEGWHSHCTKFVAGLPPAQTIERRASMAAWPWLAFLGVAFGIGGLRIRPRVWIVATAAIAIVCIVVPPPLAAVASGAFLGLLAAPWIRYAWTRNSETNVNRSVKVDRIRALTSSLVFIAPLVFAANAAASALPSRAPLIHRVLIPVDSEQRQVGDKVFVGDEFLRVLLERTNDGTSLPAWYIRELQCNAQAVPIGEARDSSGRWRLTLEVDSFARDVAVNLPFVRSEADWPISVSVDGIATPLDWKEDGRSCQIEIAEPGRHRLQIRCVPRILDDATRRRAELSVPPIASGRFRLSSLVPIADVRLNARDAAPRGVDSQLSWECELTGATKLEASWARTTASTAATEPVEQLQWLVLSRDEAVLYVQFRSTSQNAAADTLAVLVEDRWVPFEPIAASSDEISEQDGATQIQLPWNAGSEGRRTPIARFRLRDDAVLGRLIVPHVLPTTARPTRSTIGVSFDDSLACEPKLAAVASAADFAAAWGDERPSDDPQIALDLAASEPGCFLAVQPSAAQPAEADTAPTHRTASEGAGSVEQPVAVPEAAVAEHIPPPSRAESDVAGEAESKPPATPSPPGSTADEGGSIRLVDTKTLVGPSGGVLVVTRFVIDPQGLDQVKLWFPPEMQLLSLLLNGHRPTYEQLGPLELRLGLHSSRLPQIVDVVSRDQSKVDSERGRIGLRRPHLKRVSGIRLPVKLSLWSLCRSYSEGRATAASASASTSAEMALLRLDALTNASEIVSFAAFEAAAVDLQNWFPHWSAALNDACEAAEKEKLPAIEASMVARVQASDDPLATAIARADAWRAQFADALPAPDESPVLSVGFESAFEGAAGRWSYFVSDRSHARLPVEFEFERTSPQRTRFAAIVSILAIAVVAAWMASKPATWGFLREWPLLSGITLGAAMWLWAWPSWLGFAIASVSAVLLARQAWNRRQKLATISTLVRSR